MKMKITIVIVVCLLLVTIVLTNIDNLYEVYYDMTEGLADFNVKGDKAIMKGLISKRTIKRVKDLIKEHPEVKTIVMEDVPGSIDDVSNLKASRLIRGAGLNTKVPEGGFIASGGVDFFCAGVKRTANENSEIGVHSWASEEVKNANELPKDHPEHQKYLDYYKEMGIDSDFYWFTIKSAPADSMHNMTQEERIKYGLLN
ncbi:hypothetical protein PV797_01305 [Clostridiaceae bacterium M8S5]|nr:hypothetical protein PV797_01305 [Clostridiaceae bacterium M8S5]